MAEGGLAPISPAADRLAMVEAAVEGVPGLEACDLELVRGGPSYSVETLQALAAERADRDLFLILGSDAAAGLDTWERPDELRELATFVVVDRPGGGSDVTVPDGFRAQHVEVPRLEVSSTDLRARVVDGRPLDYLLTPAVISSIAARRLYRVPG